MHKSKDAITTLPTESSQDRRVVPGTEILELLEKLAPIPIFIFLVHEADKYISSGDTTLGAICGIVAFFFVIVQFLFIDDLVHLLGLFKNRSINWLGALFFTSIFFLLIAAIYFLIKR